MRIDLKKILIISICLAINLLSSQCQAINEIIDPNEVVYIIGNDDLEEVEKYDKVSKKYTGILPEFFKRVKEKRGVNLRYLDNKKSRESNIENKQAEIISGIDGSENIDIKDKIKVFSLPSGSDIYIGFTDIADEKIKNIILEELNNLTIEEKEDIIFTSLRDDKLMSDYQMRNKYIVVFAIEICILLIVFIIIGVYINRLKSKLSKAKYIDKVTGFSNYDNFEKSYYEFLDAKTRTQYFLVDLGINVEEVEKIYGYKEVEFVLKEVAKSINEVTNDDEMFCRKTNNSFLILCKFFSKNQSIEKLKLLDKKIKNCYTKSNISVNFGIYNLKSKDNLDIAVYYALQARKSCEGKNKNHKIFTKRLLNEIQDEYNLQKNIVDAIENKEFVGYVKPIVNINNNDRVAMEVLSRLENEKLGFIKPNKFLKYIKQNEKEYQFDLIMFDNICKLINNLNENNKNIDDKIFICNLFYESLGKSYFISTLQKKLQEYKVNPSKIAISIKYDFANEDFNIKDEILKLKNLGFKIILDGLNGDINLIKNLLEIDYDYVKLSCNSLGNLEDEINKKVLKNIINLLKDSNVKIIFEDVNNKETEKVLVDLGCNLFQGKLYYEAIPVEELDNLA